MVWILQNLVDLADLFADVATTDPISGVLLAVGAVLFAFTFVVGGALALGALVDALIPESPGRAPRRASR